ncbi:MAG: cytochrome C oxidase subunit III [Helicobacteraceae bacterium 4484_230]|nr:MAG: cytochrome C oxidase subunit III [Helicobacteraceae bacterium 4484_230]
MRQLFLLLIFTSLFSAESFITQEEYAWQLYHNPRGIGCYLCHGERGEGKLIADYIHKGEKKAFHPPAINSLSYEQFSQALKRRNKGMPRYFLTIDEMHALYYYLHPEKEKK